jgi:hypothetical protein
MFWEEYSTAELGLTRGSVIKSVLHRKAICLGLNPQDPQFGSCSEANVQGTRMRSYHKSSFQHELYPLYHFSKATELQISEDIAYS